MAPALNSESNNKRRTYLSNSRVVSAVELTIGAAIVVGYNVFHFIPNEVPILFVLGLVSVRLRDGSFSAIGFKRPASWSRIVLIALGAAVLRIALGEFVIDPLTERFWPPAIAPAEAESITGNIKYALLALLLVWTFAAFGEEIAYRGYLLIRAGDLGNRSTTACWVAVILTSILFGVGHYYKGPSGMIDSGFAGLILGAAYMITSRNLWTSVLAHGFIDTIGVTVLYFGWDS